MPRVRRSRTSSRNSLTIMALMPSTIGTPGRKSQQLMKFWLERPDLMVWCHDGLDTARRAMDARGPVRVPLALPAGGGAAGDGCAAGGAGVRTGRGNSARPGLFRTGGVAGLVRQLPRVVRDRR